ncbi:MAG: hypothetical protein ABH860_01780 [bacterium]
MNTIRGFITTTRNLIPGLGIKPFTDCNLQRLFSNKKISLPPSIQIRSLLKSFGIATYGEARKAASRLEKLGIREIQIEPEVNIEKAIIDKETLMNVLGKYIDQEQRLEKIIARNMGLRSYWIEGEDLILAQKIGLDVKVDKANTEKMLRALVSNLTRNTPTQP